MHVYICMVIALYVHVQALNDITIEVEHLKYRRFILVFTYVCICGCGSICMHIYIYMHYIAIVCIHARIHAGPTSVASGTMTCDTGTGSTPTLETPST